MRTVKYINLVLWMMFCLAGCKDSTPNTQPDQPRQEPNVSETNEPTGPESTAIPDRDTMTITGKIDIMNITGKIVYKDLEGGFFAIDGDDGRKYDPIGLPKDFQKDGLKVKVKARLRPDAMSMHMYGTIIDIVDIIAQ